MKYISAKIPDRYFNSLELLIKMKKYESRSDAIREGIRLLLKKEGFDGDEEVGESRK